MSGQWRGIARLPCGPISSNQQAWWHCRQTRHSRMSHTHDLCDAIQNRCIAPYTSNYRGAFLLCVAARQLNTLVVLDVEIDSVLAQSACKAPMIATWNLWVLRKVPTKTTWMGTCRSVDLQILMLYKKLCLKNYRFKHTCSGELRTFHIK